MFDLTDKYLRETNVAELKSEDKVENMNSEILSMINCPTILAGMSHEMRTHMNAIVAFSFLMNNNDCKDEDRQQFSNHILTSCEQLMVLFDNFLDSAIIDTGNSKAELRKCKLNNILDELLSELRVILKREDHKDLELILENQSTNSSEFFIDANSIVRVIRSLFQNALNNTKSGYIKIGYYFRDGNLTFYVLDSGQGYSKCKEFLQTTNLNDSLSRHNDICSAINLTLARKLITLMGGNVWIENNGLSGTGMYFSVPVKEVENSRISINKYFSTRIAI